MDEMVRQAGLMASAIGIPTIIDADSGYGGWPMSNCCRGACRVGPGRIGL